MNRTLTFTILSTRASLVEVDGNGPYYMLPGGVRVADGARTKVLLDLAQAPVRLFRVEAPQTVPTAVIVAESPQGAFAHVRRCVEPELPKKWWRVFAADRRPRVRSALQRRTPSIAALWYLLTDAVQGCRWQDIGDNNTNQVMARGGDVVVVTFVDVEDDHAA